ncbi:hypothetical protein AMELA_G00257090 [Ameiurus melas]|uniref:Uncharacterized protein n=1 Tax=Ameiurus melas TaxID=219545 RepID=A0A7J5ZSC2_AMEME|nr:hypothetical protein AMELA_G00257090 [Ameiurus melas]
MILVVITKPEKQPSNMAHKAKETSQGEHNDNEKEEGWDIVATDVPQEQHSTVITQPEKQQINMDHKENESNQGNHNDDEKEEDFDLVDKGEIQGVIGNKYFILSTGKTMNADTTIIDRLKEQIPDLQEVSEVDESDFILVLCPVVSRAGTDIEAAVQKLRNISDTKPALLVVLHHTFDPECVVPDSSRAVNRENTFTVDCLFHEDHGLLKCPKNDKSFATVTNHIQPLVPRQTWYNLNIASMCPWSFPQLPSFPSISNLFIQGEEKTQERNIAHVFPGNKYFILSTGKTMNADTTIIERLKEQLPDLQKVSEVDESDFILVLCPVVSRAGTDIEAAVQKLHNISDTKPAFLVVLHHTFDPECVVPDSSRAVKRENTTTVDCLFHEDHGLLKCPKNDKSFATVTNHIQPPVPRQTLFFLKIEELVWKHCRLSIII